MGRFRTYALGLGVGSLLGVYVVAWLHLPAFLGLAAAALVLVLILILAAAIGGDPASSDRAWREAALDLAGRRPSEPGRFEPSRWSQPKPPRVGGSPEPDRSGESRG